MFRSVERTPFQEEQIHHLILPPEAEAQVASLAPRARARKLETSGLGSEFLVSGANRGELERFFPDATALPVRRGNGLLSLASDTVVVGFPTEEVAERAFQQVPGTKGARFDGSESYECTFRFSAESPSEIEPRLDSVIREFGRLGALYAEPDYKGVRQVLPQERFRFAAAMREALAAPESPWEILGVKEAHRLTMGSAEVPIALLDDAVDQSHPSLDVAEVYDVIEDADSMQPSPKDYHATAIAGILVGNGRLGVRGIAPRCPLIAVRIFRVPYPDVFLTRVSWIRRGLDFASKRAKVINMSFTSTRSQCVSRGLSLAAQRGCVMVAAAGNDTGESTPLFPASHSQVISVSGCDPQGEILRDAPSWLVDLAAPGFGYRTADPAGDGAGLASASAFLTDFSGSSPAAAAVSATAALMLSRAPGLNRMEVRQRLSESADTSTPRRIVAPVLDTAAAVRAAAPTSPAANRAGGPTRSVNGRAASLIGNGA